MVKNLPTTQEARVQPVGWENPLEKDSCLEYSCLENSMDGGAWRATVCEITKSQT